MTSITQVGNGPVVVDYDPSGFTWVTSKGARWWPRDMGTRYIFNAIRVIHECAMDPDMRRGENILIRTHDEFEFTPSYIEAAITHLGQELLSRRDDLEDWQVVELTRMVRPRQSLPKIEPDEDAFLRGV
jgi:hypothetical protein